MWFGAEVVLVGILLVVGAHTFAYYDLDLIVVAGSHVYRAVIVYHLEISAGRKCLAQFVVVIESFAEEVEVAIVNIKFVAEGMPIHPVRLRGNQPGRDDENHQENSTHAYARRAHAFALCLLVLDQLDDAPNNQQ